jgi:hypothetical protein
MRGWRRHYPSCRRHPARPKGLPGIQGAASSIRAYIRTNVCAPAKFTRLDAEDIFDFARAICEYVFVLTVRFERFKERATAKQKPKAKS